MADEIIQIRRTATPNPPTIPSADGVTQHLLAGEPSFAIAAANLTKMWIGDGAGGNRLLLSTADADAPLFTAHYLKLSGGNMAGEIHYTGTPSTGSSLVNRTWVEQAISSGQLYQGTWNAQTNTPPLNPPVPAPSHGFFWIVNVAGPAPSGMNGITAGTTMNVGTRVEWNGNLTMWETVPGGGITLQEADARYVQLGGSNMTGPLILSGPLNAMSVANQAVTKQDLEDGLADTMSSVEVDDVSITGDGTTASPLKVARVDGGTY